MCDIWKRSGGRTEIPSFSLLLRTKTLKEVVDNVFLPVKMFQRGVVTTTIAVSNQAGCEEILENLMWVTGTGVKVEDQPDVGELYKDT